MALSGGTALAVKVSMRFFTLLPLMLAGCAGAAATLPSATLPAPSRTAASGSEPSQPPASSPAPSAFDSLHPHCVAQLFFGEARVSLASCGEAVGELSVEGTWRNFMPTGEGNDGREFEGFEVLGHYGRGEALRYLVNGGGTGNFTGVMVVTVEGSELVRHDIVAPGDRCNGGLVAAYMDGEALIVAQSITPADVVEASEGGRALHLVAYEHLDASASSCVAEARYRWVNGASTLLDITFTEAPSYPAEWTNRFAFQSCFNSLVASRIEAGQGTLTPLALEAFTQDFAARCTSPE